jgi:integrase
MTGTITRYKRKDGNLSWGYYFKSEGRQFTKSGFKSKDEASEALRSAIKGTAGTPPIAVQDGSRPLSSGDKRTLNEYLQYWLDEHAALRCAPTTMELYRKLAAYLVRHLGHIRICDLKTASIQEMVNRLQLHGGAKTKEHPVGRPLSVKRTHAIASLLYTCLADAVRLEHLSSHPMADRRVKMPKRVKARPAVLDPEMLGKLFRAARGTRAYPFIVLAASSGARRGELCALTWKDIDFEKGALSITKSLEQTRANGLRLKTTKSGEPRYFDLDEFALEVLAEHREEHARDKAMFGRDYRDLGLVFCQPNGYYWSPNNIGLRVSELLCKAGLDGFSLHSLRHSHASVLLSKGTPLSVVSQRLGHANQNITLSVYSHALPTDMRAAAKAWHNALAEVIAEDRKNKSPRSLGKSRKLAVNS